MIKHIVLLKLANNITDIQIESAMQKLHDLKNGLIPQIKSFTHGKNCSIENLHQGFNYGFIMGFENSSDRDYYVEHEAHKKIATEDILPMAEKGAESVVVLDFSE